MSPSDEEIYAQVLDIVEQEARRSGDMAALRRVAKDRRELALAATMRAADPASVFLRADELGAAAAPSTSTTAAARARGEDQDDEGGKTHADVDDEASQGRAP